MTEATTWSRDAAGCSPAEIEQLLALFHDRRDGELTAHAPPEIRYGCRRGAGRVLAWGSDVVGRIGSLYLQDGPDEVAWLTVVTDPRDDRDCFVPLDLARIMGQDIAVPYGCATIESAPRVDRGGSLTPAQEEQLFLYYDRLDLADRTATDPFPRPTGLEGAVEITLTGGQLDGKVEHARMHG